MTILRWNKEHVVRNRGVFSWCCPFYFFLKAQTSIALFSIWKREFLRYFRFFKSVTRESTYWTGVPCFYGFQGNGLFLGYLKSAASSPALIISKTILPLIINRTNLLQKLKYLIPTEIQRVFSIICVIQFSHLIWRDGW